jgi:hypothetical protein
VDCVITNCIFHHPKKQKPLAENGLGETRAYALIPQPETGTIDCVRHLHYGRLSLGQRHQTPFLGIGSMPPSAAMMWPD